MTDGDGMGTAIYLGVDPGASGGMAALWSDGMDTEAIPMPDTERDIWTWIKPFGSLEVKVFAAIEQVGGFMGSGKKGAPNMGAAHTMFTFGASYGKLRMALTAADIPFEAIIPTKWQKGLRIPPKRKEEKQTQWKTRLKEVAQRLFPNIQVTKETADALLIATYCQRWKEGKL